MEVLAEATNLNMSFNGREVLKDINASFVKGKIIGLIGPDGAGKTTLIRIMAGLLKPMPGHMKILNKDTILDAQDIHQFISYMPQRFGLYEDLSVLQNLTLYADLFSLSEDEKKNRFEILLKFTNLTSFTKRLAKHLSGGMKQKLGLACALLRKPKLLLLDEPSVGVDPISRRELWDMVIKLLEDDISVLWSTSYLDEAEKCDQVMLLNEGKMLYFGHPKELTDKLNGKTFLVVDSKDKRKDLQELIKKPEVIDGTLQGDFIRIVTNTKNPQIQNLKEVSPRFEDAFIELLGKSIKQESVLAKKTKLIEDDKKPAVEVKNLIKKFGNFTAVDNVSFLVNKREIFGLLGPNGAGKSTTFKMLCGLLRPTSGEAFIAGLSLDKVKSFARFQIGYMAQKFSLYENMSVLQNLKFFAGIYALKSNVLIEEIMDIFELIPFRNQKAMSLSLGFKQRLALACATMHQPKILFLDEPTSGVDPLTRREFWNHINGLVKKGVAIVITTHFMDEAEYCDRIALINKGKIIKIGSPAELKKEVKNIENPTLEDAFIFLSKNEEI